MGWLIALGIVVLIALIPVGIRFFYNDAGSEIFLLIGPVPVKLKLQKKQKDKGSKEETKKKSQKPAGKSGGQKGGKLSDFLPIVETFLDFLSDFRRKLVVTRLNAKLIMGGDDPCDLAISYGSAQAIMANLIAVLENSFRIKRRNVEVECDFTSTSTTIAFDAVIHMPLSLLLWLVGRHGTKALRQYFSIHKKHKGGVKYESKTSQYVRKYHRKNS